eukprot:462835-Rhodomonas_salina.2
MSGTDIGSGPREQAKHEADDTMAHVIDTRMLLPGSRCLPPPRHAPLPEPQVLSPLSSYAVSGTDVGYAATRCRELQQEVNWLAGNMTTGRPEIKSKTPPFQRGLYRASGCLCLISLCNSYETAGTELA